MEVTSTARIGDKHIFPLQDEFPELRFHTFASAAEARPFFAQTEILLTFGNDLTSADVEGMPELKWLYVMSAGVDRVPLAQLEKKGVIVTNARGIHAVPMAEHAFGLMLGAARQSRLLFARQLEHQWDRETRFFELSGLTLGIVGTGAIGSEIARKAAAFDMQVIGLNTDGRPVRGFSRAYSQAGLHELLRLSDIVVLCLPLTPQTRHLVAAAEFDVMKESAWLINIARGAVVDEPALISALRSRRIAGACLDVFEAEPLPAESPLWEMTNVIITPHVAGTSPSYMTRAIELLTLNYRILRSGRTDLINRVTTSKGY